MSGWVHERIQKHRGTGVFLDSNLLLLWVVGRCDPQAIARFKRTRQFDADDFRILKKFLGRFRQHFASGHVLTEVSNFLGQFTEPLRTDVFGQLRTELEWIEERIVISRDAADDAAFESFGLTDAAICRICAEGLLLLTDDLRLARYAESRSISTLNFHHLRSLRGS